MPQILKISNCDDISSFNLAETFNCGQCFRWSPLEDGSFDGVAFSKHINVSIKNKSIFIKGSTNSEFEGLWKAYFDLDRDYTFLRKEIEKKHPFLKIAAEYAPGIRILRQDPWEVLCSFIISQNNNIPRIKGIIERLCKSFGEPLAYSNKYSFPTANKLCSLREQDLAPLRCGFRWKYILDAAKKIANKEIILEELRGLPLKEAREILCTILGVGPKVAECTLLYGLHRLEAFPMDTWMKKAMTVLFPQKTPEFFGDYAGIAQQYIFHYCRLNPDSTKMPKFT
jgi:N-glycosylase/DNA lyase